LALAALHMPHRSYYLHQAQTCRSLATIGEPELKHRYLELELYFLCKAGLEVEDEDGDEFPLVPDLPSSNQKA
jgi:hypothetical protein